MDKKNFGAFCEDRVALWLQAKGWRVLERNVRFREGELDIIAERDGLLRFVEVKGRRSEMFGAVVESLTEEKLRRMKRAIWKWRKARGDRREGELWFVGVMVKGEVVEIEEYVIG